MKPSALPGWLDRGRKAEPWGLGDPDFSPDFWASGAGSNVVDLDGREFLDLTSAFGASIAGHAPLHVREALQAQAGEIFHTMGLIYSNTVRIELCELVLSVYGFCASEYKVALTNSGSEAVDLALKLVSVGRKAPRILSYRNSFHGQALGPLNVMGQENLRSPFEGMLSKNVDFADFVEEGVTWPSSADETLRLVSHGAYSAVVIEPIQGLAGYRFLDHEYAAALSEAANKSQTPIVADEIFSGSWRAGSALHSKICGLTPDIVCLGKAFSGGLPISAVVATADSWLRLERVGFLPLYGGTFWGDPLLASGAIAQLRWLSSAETQRQVGELERILQTGLQPMMSEPSVRVRGRGLLWAIEILGEGAHEQASSLVSEMRELGVIVVQTGFPKGNVVGLAPPAVIASQQMKEAIDGLTQTARRVVCRD